MTPDLAAPGVDLLIPLLVEGRLEALLGSSLLRLLLYEQQHWCRNGRREEHSLCIWKYGEVLSAERGSERRTDGIPQSGMGIWKTGSVSDI